MILHCFVIRSHLVVRSAWKLFHHLLLKTSNSTGRAATPQLLTSRSHQQVIFWIFKQKSRLSNVLHKSYDFDLGACCLSRLCWMSILNCLFRWETQIWNLIITFLQYLFTFPICIFPQINLNGTHMVYLWYWYHYSTFVRVYSKSFNQTTSPPVVNFKLIFDHQNAYFNVLSCENNSVIP